MTSICYQDLAPDLDQGTRHVGPSIDDVILFDKIAVFALEFPIMISFVEAPMAAVTDSNNISLTGARFRIILNQQPCV